jgi:ornithine cyclodeaminase/alanine dehydrogenase-like protein (mu-crystallin family)
MRTYTRAQIRAAMTIGDMLEPVAEALKAHARGQVDDAISHLHPNHGEVHIKAGYRRGGPVFAVKVAAGFANNAARGLPVWDGLVLAFDANTGQPVALLQDGGLLTDWRTAAAGAIATRAFAPRARTLGIVGAGLQGFWQPIAHKAALPRLERVLIWARDVDRARALAQRLAPELPAVQITVQDDLRTLVQASDAIVTVTASRSPLIHRDWLRDGQHVTAVGADDADKHELALDVLRDARAVAVDARDVNTRYGDVAHALRAGMITLERCIELGALLEHPELIPAGSGYTVAKLIGLGVQDLASVEAALSKLTA